MPQSVRVVAASATDVCCSACIGASLCDGRMKIGCRCLESEPMALCPRYGCSWQWNWTELPFRGYLLNCIEVSPASQIHIADTLKSVNINAADDCMLDVFKRRVTEASDGSFDWVLVNSLAEKMTGAPRRRAWKTFFSILRKADDIGADEVYNSIIQSLNNFNYTAGDYDATDFGNVLHFLLKCPMDSSMNCNLVQKLLMSADDVHFLSKWRLLTLFLNRVNPNDLKGLLVFLSKKKYSAEDLIEIGSELGLNTPVELWNFYNKILMFRSYAGANGQINQIMMSMTEVYIERWGDHAVTVIASLYSFSPSELPDKWIQFTNILEAMAAKNQIVQIFDSTIPKDHMLVLEEICEFYNRCSAVQMSHAMDVFKIILERIGKDDTVLSVKEMKLFMHFVKEIPDSGPKIPTELIFTNIPADRNALLLRLEMFQKRDSERDGDLKNEKCLSVLSNILTNRTTIGLYGDLGSFWNFSGFGNIRFLWYEQNFTKFSAAERISILNSILQTADFTIPNYLDNLMTALKSLKSAGKSKLAANYLHGIFTVVGSLTYLSPTISWECLAVLYDLSENKEILLIPHILQLQTKNVLQKVCEDYVKHFTVDEYQCDEAFECSLNILFTIKKRCQNNVQLKNVLLSPAVLSAIDKHVHSSTHDVSDTFYGKALANQIRKKL